MKVSSTASSNPRTCPCQPAKAARACARSPRSDNCLSRGGSEQTSEPVSQPDGHVEPAGGIPAPDQVVTPFLLDGAIEDARRGARHRAQRVAVEIDHAIGNSEAIAQASKRIAQVASDARIARIDGGK